MPVLIVTGSADQHARLSDVQELFDQIEWHAQLIVFDGAAHEPLVRYDPQRYASTLLRFLESNRDLCLSTKYPRRPTALTAYTRTPH
jgi:alpha-beta hydrolase superfamily lysophospholipase